MTDRYSFKEFTDIYEEISASDEYCDYINWEKQEPNCSNFNYLIQEDNKELNILHCLHDQFVKILRFTVRKINLFQSLNPYGYLFIAVCAEFIFVELFCYGEDIMNSWFEWLISQFLSTCIVGWTEVEDDKGLCT